MAARDLDSNPNCFEDLLARGCVAVGLRSRGCFGGWASWAIVVVMSIVLAACADRALLGVTEAGGDESADSLDPDLESSGCSGGDSSTEDPACAIDFLFVIDNSASMTAEQGRMIAAVPGFLESLERTPLGRHVGSDFHLMVVDTDANALNGAARCESGNCTCSPKDVCCPRVCYNLPDASTCNDRHCDDWGPPECEFMLGAGRSRNWWTDAACDFSGSGAYLTGADDVTRAFTCAASVGNQGMRFEQVISAMVHALAVDDPVAMCNRGFRRPHAELVIVFASDEDFNEVGGGEPEEWFDQLRSSLGDDLGRVIMLGLIGDLDTAAPQCQSASQTALDGARPAPEFRAFLEMFGRRGMARSICARDYGAYLDELVPHLARACRDRL